MSWRHPRKAGVRPKREAVSAADIKKALTAALTAALAKRGERMATLRDVINSEFREGKQIRKPKRNVGNPARREDEESLEGGQDDV